MRHPIRLVASACIFMSIIVCMILCSLAVGHPMPPRHDYPGIQFGEERHAWIGPYVSGELIRIGDRSQTTIRWYDTDGKIVREIVLPDYKVLSVSSYVSVGNKLYAVNGDWSFIPIARKSVGGLHDMTPDSVGYLNSFKPEEELVAADLYLRGKLASSVGPFYQYKGNDSLQLGNDGSMAIIAWDGTDKKVPQAIALTSSGLVRVRANCDESAGWPIVAPNAAGVIVKPSTGDREYTFFSADGKKATLPAGTDPMFYFWLPGTTKAFMDANPGAEFRLIECQTGEILWRLKVPPTPEGYSAGPIGVAGGYILIEPADSGRAPDPERRTLYAVDTADGKIVSEFVGRWNSLRLLTLSEKYYLITDNAFSELDLRDIKEKKNGWH